MALDDLLTLGRSGLRVSPICLGAMTFGNGGSWLCDEPTSHALIDAYLDAGGNFIDTANGYTNGMSEEIVGRAFRESSRRTRAVIATKWTFGGSPKVPNTLGNGRKNAHKAIEDSLRRLATDWIDLYWLHAWDGVTPYQEVAQIFDALVRSGKILYYGLSDVPAWWAARLFDYAERNGLATPIAFQLEYSLAERVIEREHLPFAQQAGLGLCPWGPIASGLLSGKYKRGEEPPPGRMQMSIFHRDRLGSERLWTLLDVLHGIAEETGHSVVQIAIRWVLSQYHSTSVITGVTRLEQLQANLGALDVALTPEQWQRLDDVSWPNQPVPYRFFNRRDRASRLGAVRGFDPDAGFSG